MKTLNLLTVLFILLSVSTIKSQEKSIQSVLNITITDMKGKPSEGDKLFFVNEKSKEIKTCISGEAGKCKIELTNGETYQIKIKSFDMASNHTSVKIADTDYRMNLQINIKYELPKTYTLNNVQFATGSAKLKPGSYKSLNELAELMSLKKHLILELSGHTDNTGNSEANKKLSQKRANAVKQYLIRKGIKTNRLVAIGYGDTRPIEYNDTKEGRKKNRRTEVKIMKD